MEKIVKIKDFDDYYISDQGNVYSTKTGNFIKLNPYVDTKGNYLMIRLIRNDGKRKSLLIHRLVEMRFIPNPNNLLEVNHKDKNKRNSVVTNLEWCTRKENLYDSYTTMSPVRNKNESILYKNDEFIESFESITAAAKYAKEKYNASITSLIRNLKYKDLKIIVKNKDKKNIAS